jgi:hypothetical protein
MIWRTKMQANVRHRVQPKDSICFKESKLVRIQFASNESKLVPRNLDPESPSTLHWALACSRFSTHVVKWSELTFQHVIVEMI